MCKKCKIVSCKLVIEMLCEYVCLLVMVGNIKIIVDSFLCC